MELNLRRDAFGRSTPARGGTPPWLCAPALNEPPMLTSTDAGVLGEVNDRRRRRVLIVDDNREAAHALAILLDTLGHEVRTAADGEEGVELAAQLRPDAVLLDLNMPRLDGYAAARRIRATPWGQELLLVALTARGGSADRHESVEAGFDFHLVKPADAMVIARMIEALGD